MKERGREKEEERKWDGTCTPAGKLKASQIWGSPLTDGEISWDRRGALEAQRRMQQSVAGRTD